MSDDDGCVLMTLRYAQISFNGGAHWQNLERPETFRHSVCDQCSQMADPSKCKLHLHGPASYGYYTVQSELLLGIAS